MKKVLILFGGSTFSEGAFEFARQLNEKSEILLVGDFIPQLSYDRLLLVGPEDASVVIPLLKEELEAVNKNIEKFKDLCLKNNIAYHVHSNYDDYTIPQFRTNTRFSDLFIFSSDKFYEDLTGTDAKDYLKDAIHAAECPIIIIPTRFHFPERNIFAYNGSEESVYAVKQFMYILPELRKNPSTFVFAKDDEDDPIPFEFDIREWAEAHLTDPKFLKLEIDPKKYFSTWIMDQQHSLLIGGAPHKPKISNLFKKSFFQDVISKHELPIFVSHKKN